MINQQVHLVSRTITPEVKVRGFARVITGLKQFTDDPGFEQGATLNMSSQLLAVLDAQQPGGNTGIQKICKF